MLNCKKCGIAISFGNWCVKCLSVLPKKKKGLQVPKGLLDDLKKQENNQREVGNYKGMSYWNIMKNAGYCRY